MHFFSKISPVICPRISSRILSKNQSRIRLAIFITRNSTGDSFSNSTDISVSQRAVGENLVWVAPKVEFRQKLLQGFVLEFLEEILKKIFMDFFKKSFREFLKLFHALRLFQKCIQLFHQKNFQGFFLFWDSSRKSSRFFLIPPRILSKTPVSAVAFRDGNLNMERRTSLCVLFHTDHVLLYVHYLLSALPSLLTRNVPKTYCCMQYCLPCLQRRYQTMLDMSWTLWAMQ